MAEAAIVASFLAGVAGFASPCVLPLIPSYLAYLGGVSRQGGKGGSHRIFINAISFVSGLTLSLAAIGFALELALGFLSGEMLLLSSRISGAAIMLFGLYVLGIVRLDFFEKRHGLMLPKSASLAASFSLGALFGIVWTPVMGAFLSFVIALAVASDENAPLLLFSYACGLGLPFLVAGAFAGKAEPFIKAHGNEMAIFEKAMGLVVVIIGALLLIGGLPAI